MVAWGDNLFDQTNVPAGLSGVTAIAAGDYFGLALAPPLATRVLGPMGWIVVGCELLLLVAIVAWVRYRHPFGLHLRHGPVA